MVNLTNRTTKILENKDDKELRRIHRKLYKTCEKIAHTRWKLEDKIAECEQGEKTCDTLIEKIQFRVGQRKGDKCPALKITTEETWSTKIHGNIKIKYYNCRIGNSCYHTSFKFFQKCFKCKLSRKRAFQQMVYEGVFVKNPRYEHK